MDLRRTQHEQFTFNENTFPANGLKILITLKNEIKRNTKTAQLNLNQKWNEEKWKIRKF